MRRLRPDLVHNLFNTAPAFPGAPQVTTIHDLIHRTVPETHSRALGLGLRLLVDSRRETVSSDHRRLGRDEDRTS